MTSFRKHIVTFPGERNRKLFLHYLLQFQSYQKKKGGEVSKSDFIMEITARIWFNFCSMCSIVASLCIYLNPSYVFKQVNLSFYQSGLRIDFFISLKAILFFNFFFENGLNDHNEKWSYSPHISFLKFS